MSSSDAISPTAHYTGYVWAHNGLSHPGLVTREGQVFFAALQPAMLVSRRLGGPSLEDYLLARHRAIDARVTEAIDSGAATQVLEVAAGMSPRGWRFAQRYGDRIRYVEADLPAMAERKRRALERMGALTAHHQVRDVDALRDSGPGSLAELTRDLDQSQGLVIVTEGLLGYLAPDDMAGLWRRFAQALRSFSSGRYVSDLHLGDAVTPVVRGFRLLLAGFVRGQVHLHFQNASEAEAALRSAAFARAQVVPADATGETGPGRGARLAHILDAST